LRALVRSKLVGNVGSKHVRSAIRNSDRPRNSIVPRVSFRAGSMELSSLLAISPSQGNQSLFLRVE
jgi:hypothetical protein